MKFCETHIWESGDYQIKAESRKRFSASVYDDGDIIGLGSDFKSLAAAKAACRKYKRRQVNSDPCFSWDED